VIDGADSTLDMMEKVPVNEKNRPTKEIRLLNVCLAWRAMHSSLMQVQVTIHANPVADATK
jgi:peptidyl-prolyl cis-trans isomerase-like 3